MIVTTRWWWIRHARVINPGGHIYGQRDLDAACTPSDPFAALARQLPRDSVWLVTHLRRTVQTAAAIRAEMPESLPETEPAVEPDFVEQHFGDWQGMSHAALHASRPGQSHRFWLAPATERPPGGESFADVVTRVSAAVLRRSQTHAGRDIVAVAHGGSIRAALVLALGLDPERALSLSIDNVSLTRIDHIAVPGEPPAWRVVTVNRTP